MLRKMTLLLLAGVLALTLMGAESCGTTTTESEPDGKSEKASSSKKKKKAKKPKRARVGDSITLEGNNDARMRVTLLEVIDPLQGGEFDQAEQGNRLVGVRIALKNVGDVQYDDSPGNGAVLITRSDEEANTTILTGGACESNFSSGTKIAPGSRRQGCIPFEVPEGKRLKTFQFTLDSGFGPAAGEWSTR